ncbi:HNH endonuclease [Aerococcaceae bacterium DSM 111176]|nr:HNH endonuclease [Aerococcaceae bacterium DSM 111176]
MFNGLNSSNLDFSKYMDDFKVILSNHDGWAEEYGKRILKLITFIENDIEKYEKDYTLFFSDNSFNGIEIIQEVEELFHDKNSDWKQIKKDIKNTVDKIHESCVVDTDYICPVCGLPMSKDSKSNYYLSIDHVIPKKEYLQYILYPDNLVPMCRECNRNKSGKISKNLFHPYLHNYNILPKESILIEPKPRYKKKKVRSYKLNYKWNTDNSILKENYEEIFLLNAIYQSRIYYSKIKGVYAAKVTSFIQHNNYEDEQLKRVLLKDISKQINTLSNKVSLDDEEELELLSLKVVENDIDTFYSSIKNDVIKVVNNHNNINE